MHPFFLLFVVVRCYHCNAIMLEWIMFVGTAKECNILCFQKIWMNWIVRTNLYWDAYVNIILCITYFIHSQLVYHTTQQSTALSTIVESTIFELRTHNTGDDDGVVYFLKWNIYVVCSQFLLQKIYDFTPCVLPSSSYWIHGRNPKA